MAAIAARNDDAGGFASGRWADWSSRVPPRGKRGHQRPTSNFQRPIRGDRFSNVRAIFAAFIGRWTLDVGRWALKVFSAFGTSRILRDGSAPNPRVPLTAFPSLASFRALFGAAYAPQPSSSGSQQAVAGDSR